MHSAQRHKQNRTATLNFDSCRERSDTRAPGSRSTYRRGCRHQQALTNLFRWDDNRTPTRIEARTRLPVAPDVSRLKQRRARHSAGSSLETAAGQGVGPDAVTRKVRRRKPPYRIIPDGALAY